MKVVLLLLTLLSLLTAGGGKMEKAYKLSKSLVTERLHNEDNENRELLADITKSDLVVVKGTYDHIHLVLNHLDMPYVELSAHQLPHVELKPEQTVFVNCASSFPAESARRLATFVKDGGQLITTDWALLNVIEVAFPGFIKYNQRATGDDVVPIEVVHRHDPVIKGFIDEKTEPVWWLEGSSYPIKVLDRERVTVLMKSKELKKRYGEAPVIVKFEFGEGVVYHMISHFYLQRSETRTAKQATSATNYSKDKGASAEVQEMWDKEGAGLNYGDVQSANTSSEFLMRAIVGQKKRVKERNKK